MFSFEKTHSFFITIMTSVYFFATSNMNDRELFENGMSVFIIINIMIAFFLFVEMVNNNQTYKELFFFNFGFGLFLPSLLNMYIEYHNKRLWSESFNFNFFVLIVGVLIICYSIYLKLKKMKEMKNSLNKLKKG